MNQLCKVCSEPAAGFHFGAFTCEGCKSFFGRTYNNLSQIHECKNGGQCVINKQNRTSCKACRLRKCLMVGMSKTGSRYGRRSNWFKIHCLLTEQCSFNNTSNPVPSFRSPVTPTLQDGSLPFVNSHLRDALHSLEGDQQQQQLGAPAMRLPITTSSDGASLMPPCSVGSGGAVSEPRITGNFAVGQLGAMERRLQEEAMNALRRGTNISGSDLEASYREQLFEAIRRSHSLQPPRQFDTQPLQNIMMATPSPDTDQVRRMGVEFERIRRVSAESETRLSVIPPYEWERRLQENPAYPVSESSKPPSPHNSKGARNTKSPVIIECPTSCNTIKLEHPDTENEATNKRLKADQNNGRSSANRSPTNLNGKSQTDSKRLQEVVETPMTEEERLLFLKTASKTSSNNIVSRDSGALNNFPNFPVIIPPRSTSRDDMLFSPLNFTNNMFPFPPMWPSILPFPSLAKFYAPFNSPALPNSSVPFDNMKNLRVLPNELRTNFLSNLPSDLPKADSSSKKRILDAILQVQRSTSCGSRSPVVGMSPLSPTAVSVALTMPQLVTSASVMPLIVSTTTTAAHHREDQPIDLTVRRKRKMAKSEIMYQPCEEEAMESEFDKEVEEADERDNEIIHSDHRLSKEIFVKGTSEIVDLKTTLECSTSMSEPTKFEAPLKIMKLETSSDTLIVSQL